MAQTYFDKISALESPSSHSDGSRSGVNQTTWGILMYAYVVARDVRGALRVLNKAKAWIQDTSVTKSARTAIDESDSDRHKTNHLINMAMAVLIERKDPTGALALLDDYMDKYSNSQRALNTAQTAQGLPATSADPITLNLILRALLLNNQLQHAVTIYDTVHSKFKLLETPDALRPLLRYYVQRNNLEGVFLLIKRMFKLGGIPTLKELFYMVRLSVYKRDPALILYLYDKMGTSTTPDADSKFIYFLKRKPDMMPLVYWALTENGREADALVIESAIAKTVPRPHGDLEVLQPSTPTQHKTAAAKVAHGRCIALYRDLLREIDAFPLVELRRKLRYNVRFVFELYRDLKPNNPLIVQLLDEGRQQKKWLRSWRNDPDGCQFVTHNSPAMTYPAERNKSIK
ncbi:hypothetical protein GGI23_006778 [Coemansia sp. RSA 2559]|nr:hypothetical protein GGI23_006778 [Coemansia sp. RSA 2559]